MDQVRGHPGWWQTYEIPQGSSYLYYFNPMGNRSEIFISCEKKSYRRYMDYKYEIFQAGAGVNNTAKYIAGSNKRNEAIEKADKLIKKLGGR